MNEDVALNAALKKALESGIALPDETLKRIVAAAEAEKRTLWKSRMFHRCAFLTAASVVFAVAVSAVFSDRDRDEEFSEVIRLLANADGIELNVGDEHSAEELLLAWQEAPLAGIGL